MAGNYNTQNVDYYRVRYNSTNNDNRTWIRCVDDIWYWGDRLPSLRAAGMEHSQLLAIAAPKPFMLIGGYYDENGVNAFFAAAKPYYGDAFGNLRFINHATGHRPPMEASMAACEFLQRTL